MKSILLSLFTFLIVVKISFAQNTVGLLSVDHNKAQPGYNLFFPHNQGTAYLLNNCGEIVNKWEDFNFKPGNEALLDENGNIYLCKGNGPISNPNIHAGGGGQKVEKRDWNNNLLWEFTYNDSTKRLHHDIALLPNGNVLMIAWERKSEAEAIAAGRDTTLLIQDQLWPEHVIEVQPVGLDSGTIVWEWHVWDHLVQDYDNTKANFGVVANHPELIDLNYDNNNGNADWLHANSIDYNKDLDQIMLSIPTFHEIWIIDHSTTTAQAASHTGGLSGKGGDLIFRWGNPEAYQQGTSADRMLGYQHDAHWVDIGLTSAHNDYGKIAVFNNRAGADYSTANIINPIFVTYNWEYPMTGNVWGPTGFDWSYSAPVPQDLYSNILSSAQRLENGNTLICAGRSGYTFEVDDSSNIVWEYKNPLSGGNPVNQGDIIPLNGNLQFNMKRYMPDFPGFVGKDLASIGFIELNPNTTACTLPVNTDHITIQTNIKVFPNPIVDHITIDFGTSSHLVETIEIFDLLGIEKYSNRYIKDDGTLKIAANDWQSGMYIISINGKAAKMITVIK